MRGHLFDLGFKVGDKVRALNDGVAWNAGEVFEVMLHKDGGVLCIKAKGHSGFGDDLFIGDSSNWGPVERVPLENML